MLYIFVFLHQTATACQSPLDVFGCISLFSYIKPQQFVLIIALKSVVYLCFPTSNRNVPCDEYLNGTVVYLCFPTSNRNTLELTYSLSALYIFVFLHQTATTESLICAMTCCISLFSYIKPQLTGI